MTPGYELLLPPRGKEPAPLLLILPILGRLLCLPDFWLEKKIAGFFTKRGFACAIVERQFFLFQSGLGELQLNEYITSTVRLARQTLDALSTHPDIRQTQIASLGISFGGIINTLLCAQDTRIRAAVIALAGGPIPEILATSWDPLVRYYYRSVKNGMGWKTEEFVLKLSALLENPLDAAPKVDREKILMIIAKYDQVVRYPYAENLRQKMGMPETLYLPCGHYTSLLALPVLERKALQFYQRKFLAA